jgi:hypothetical protein
LAVREKPGAWLPIEGIDPSRGVGFDLNKTLVINNSPYFW